MTLKAANHLMTPFRLQKEVAINLPSPYAISSFPATCTLVPGRNNTCPTCSPCRGISCVILRPPAWADLPTQVLLNGLEPRLQGSFLLNLCSYQTRFNPHPLKLTPLKLSHIFPATSVKSSAVGFLADEEPVRVVSGRSPSKEQRFNWRESWAAFATQEGLCQGDTGDRRQAEGARPSAQILQPCFSRKSASSLRARTLINTLCAQRLCVCTVWYTT